METPTRHIHCVPFHQNASDDDCNEGESEGEDLSMDRAGEQMSTVRQGFCLYTMLYAMRTVFDHVTISIRNSNFKGASIWQVHRSHRT